VTVGSSIGVIGAGSWGTALAIHFAHCGLGPTLWGHSEVKLQAIARKRCNSFYLPDIHFPDTLSVTTDLAQVMACECILVCVPSRAFASVLHRLKPYVSTTTQFVFATKGLTSDGTLLSGLFDNLFPKHHVAVLSGPSFAHEVACGLPTVVTVASKNLTYAKQLAQAFSTSQFRVYASDDMLGVQLGGAVKNVLAVAAGISDGLGFGINARSGLITRGLAEMIRLAMCMGAKEKTLMGLSGLGDLILTCSDDQSRNRRFGLAIGKGLSLEAARESIGQEVESIHTVKQVTKLAKQYQVDMPITDQVSQVLQGLVGAKQAAAALFSRDLRLE